MWSSFCADGQCFSSIEAFYGVHICTFHTIRSRCAIFKFNLSTANMKKAILIAIILYAISLPAFADESLLKTVRVGNDFFNIFFEKTSMRQTLLIKKKELIQQSIDVPLAVETPSQIVIKDFNFDGVDDIGIPGDQGNVERFTEVYLFSKKSGKFERSQNLSSIPCLSVSLPLKTISGECFHSSACENWKEVYLMKAPDVLSLVEKRGYYCDPATDKAYKFSEKYRLGKLIKRNVVEFKQ